MKGNLYHYCFLIVVLRAAIAFDSQNMIIFYCLLVQLHLESVITAFVQNITWQNQQLRQDTITRAKNVELRLKLWRI